jgi:DNA helicase HerA-like ATPase
MFTGARVAATDGETIAAYMQTIASDRTPLDIGSVRYAETGARAAMLATGFDRHTFLCGQSGSGKTYSLGVVLERLLMETDLQMVILDPNSDFVKLGSSRTFDEAARGFRGVAETESDFEPLRKRYDEAVGDIRVLRQVPRGQRSPDALRLRFSSLQPTVQGMVLQLDPLEDLEEFNAFLDIRSRFGEAPYSLTDVRRAAAEDLPPQSRNLALRISNLGVDTWDIWAEADEPIWSEGSMLTWRALVLDIGGLATPAEQALVSLGIQNYIWNRRAERRPLLLVIDEAHTVCPAEPQTRLQSAATERAVQIAGEGRKFGTYLLVSTQRPQKLHPNVISQCDNLILMRMNSEGDLAHLAGVFSFVPPSLMNTAIGFRQGESLLAGKLVPSPVIVQFGGRFSQEGGGDVPTDWARTGR